jgi:hypothetical protein
MDGFHYEDSSIYPVMDLDHVYDESYLLAHSIIDGTSALYCQFQLPL